MGEGPSIAAALSGAFDARDGLVLEAAANRGTRVCRYTKMWAGISEIPGKVSSPPQFFFFPVLLFVHLLTVNCNPPPPPPLQFSATMTRPAPYSSYMVNFPFTDCSFSTLLRSTTLRGVQVSIWPLVPSRAVYCTQMIPGLCPGRIKNRFIYYLLYTLFLALDFGSP